MQVEMTEDDVRAGSVRIHTNVQGDGREREGGSASALRRVLTVRSTMTPASASATKSD